MTQAQSLQFIEMFPNLQPGLVYDIVSSSKDENEILEKLMNLNDVPSSGSSSSRPPPSAAPPGIPAYAQPPTSAPPGYPQQQQQSSLPPGYPGSINSRTSSSQQAPPPAAATPPQATAHTYGAPAYGASPQHPAPAPPTNTFTSSSSTNPAYHTHGSSAQGGTTMPAAPPVVDVSPSAVRARQQVNDMLNRPKQGSGIQQKPTGYDAAVSGVAQQVQQTTATTVNRERDYAQLAAEQSAKDAAEAIRLARQFAAEEVAEEAKHRAADAVPKLPPGLATASSGKVPMQPPVATSGKMPARRQSISSDEEETSSGSHDKHYHSGKEKGGGGWFPFSIFGGGGDSKKDKKEKKDKKHKGDDRKPEKQEVKREDVKKLTAGVNSNPHTAPAHPPTTTGAGKQNTSNPTPTTAPSAATPSSSLNAPGIATHRTPSPGPEPFSSSYPTQLAGKFSFNEQGGSDASVSRRKFDSLFNGFSVDDTPGDSMKKAHEASAIRRKEQEDAEKESQKSAQKFSFGVSTSSNVKDAQSYQTLFAGGADGGDNPASSNSFGFGGGSSSATVGSSYNFADPVGNSMSRRGGGGGVAGGGSLSTGNEFNFGASPSTTSGTLLGSGGSGGGSAPVTGTKSFDALLMGFGDGE